MVKLDRWERGASLGSVQSVEVRLPFLFYLLLIHIHILCITRGEVIQFVFFVLPGGGFFGLNPPYIILDKKLLPRVFNSCKTLNPRVEEKYPRLYSGSISLLATFLDGAHHHKKVF